MKKIIGIVALIISSQAFAEDVALPIQDFKFKKQVEKVYVVSGNLTAGKTFLCSFSQIVSDTGTKEFQCGEHQAEAFWTEVNLGSMISKKAVVIVHTSKDNAVKFGEIMNGEGRQIRPYSGAR